jgi:hypothetical protein
MGLESAMKSHGVASAYEALQAQNTKSGQERPRLRRQVRSGEGEQKHKNGNKTPQTLMRTLVDYHFLHFWYLEYMCIGGVCVENGAEK